VIMNMPWHREITLQKTRRPRSRALGYAIALKIVRSQVRKVSMYPHVWPTVERHSPGGSGSDVDDIERRIRLKMVPNAVGKKHPAVGAVGKP
jgi:hypothetical protein